MTPARFIAADTLAYVYNVYPTGELNLWGSVASRHGVRPVINIRSDVLISQGDGTIQNPFILHLLTDSFKKN